jgi:hypothetical protein
VILKRLVFAILALSPTPVLAQAQPSPAAPSNQTAAAKVNPDDRVICEREEETGSRLASKRVCMTARQWAEQRRSDREATEDAQQGGVVHH